MTKFRSDLMKTTILLLLAGCSLAVSQVTHLAVRSDGRLGTGRASDPYNASTPDKLAQAWGKAMKSGSTVVFIPGVYYSASDLAVPAGISNIVVSGYGAQIVLVGTNISGQLHAFRSDWQGNNGLVFEGFRIDAGRRVTFGASGKTCGISAIGHSVVVRDCSVQNLLSTDGTNEAFGIIVRSTNGTCSGNIVSGFTTGLATGIALCGESVSAANNSVDLGDTSETNAATTFGYSVYGSRCILSGNTARQCDAGISMDGAGDGQYAVWRDNIIVGNQFCGNTMCVRVDNNTQAYHDWLWLGNNFNAEGAAWLLMISGEQWRTNKIQGHTFAANHFSGSPRTNRNLVLVNFDHPHAFIGNSFLSEPSLYTGTNVNTLYGTANRIKGQPENLPFNYSDMGVW